MEKVKKLFYKIHNDYYRWYDFLPLTLIILILMLFGGQICGILMFQYPVKKLLYDKDPVFCEAITMYGYTIGVWIVIFIYLLFCRVDKPIIESFGTKYKGNTVKYFLIGLLVGGGMNIFCAVIAIINKDIALYFNEINIIKLFAVFITVVFQAGGEEILCRGFLYQRLRRSFRNPWVAILGNSLLFGSMHMLNPGVSFLAILNVVLFGVFMALVIYYYESMWMAIAVHTAWNYMQNIVLGLPNSGNVLDFSMFKLDAASAADSFAYNVAFGIEGTLLTSVVLGVGIGILIVLGKKRQKDNLWDDANKKRN